MHRRFSHIFFTHYRRYAVEVDGYTIMMFVWLSDQLDIFTICRALSTTFIDVSISRHRRFYHKCRCFYHIAAPFLPHSIDAFTASMTGKILLV